MDHSFTTNSESVNCNSMPDPPMQYIRLYTDENIRENCAPAPPPPITGIYESFGMFIDPKQVVPVSLEDNNIKRIVPVHFEHCKEMKKLNMSLCLAYVDMLDILLKGADENLIKEKLQDIEVLFIHFHHLINEMRPHQARETLRLMLEMQKRQRVATLLSFQQVMTQVWNMIKNTIPDFEDEDSMDISVKKPKLSNSAKCGTFPQKDVKQKKSFDERVNASLVTQSGQLTYLEEVTLKHDRAMRKLNYLKAQEQMQKDEKNVYELVDNIGLEPMPNAGMKTLINSEEDIDYSDTEDTSVTLDSVKESSVVNGSYNESKDERIEKCTKYDKTLGDNSFDNLAHLDAIMCKILDAMD